MHFLDDHANKNLEYASVAFHRWLCIASYIIMYVKSCLTCTTLTPSVQLWKYVLTGCHSSGELKLWDCQMWSCIQTIYLHPSLVSCSFDSTTNHKTSSKNRLYHANNTSAVEKDADEIGCVIEFKCVGDDDDDDTSKDTSKAPHINNNNKNVNKDGGVREVCMKAKFDLSSTFLIMSDINRRVGCLQSIVSHFFYPPLPFHPTIIIFPPNHLPTSPPLHRFYMCCMYKITKTKKCAFISSESFF